MSVKFNAADHSYKSIDKTQDINWVSVTTLISYFKKPFDPQEVAKKVSKNKRSKWYSISPEKIQAIWKKEGDRATTLGSFYHDQREADICALASMEREGVTIPVISPLSQKEGVRFAPDQKLTDGVYPEHMVYLKSAGICGQSDLVEIVNGKVNIIDYKTNKEIKKESFVNWEGQSDKLSEPLSGLDDCNFNHYALQLSIYMYIILKHNPKLKPGNIFIHHVAFEEESKDEHGYPIAKLDDQDNPIVKEVTPIAVPYLADEVITIIHYLRDNRDKLKKK